MKKATLPGYQHFDHVGITVPDLDAAVEFYCRILGAQVAYRLGPFDAAEMPLQPDGRDWMEAHVDVKGAKLSIALLQIAPNAMLELFQYDKPADRRNVGPRNCDIGGHHIALKVEKLEPALRHLEENGCVLMDGPIDLPEGPTVGCRCQYARDPWGNYIELMEYTHQAYMDETGIRPYRVD
ncbi:MAG TPA: VOC family protein [Woeseiaceae bacterium]|nr:VOC family protein [Woeseiaceae bacterium]